MAVTIHPSAVIGQGAVIGEGTVVGPFVVIESGARLGEGNQIGAGAYIHGTVEMGSHNRVFTHATLGGEPQDKGYKGEPTRLIIGSRNIIGEHITIHRGTPASAHKTSDATEVGDDNFLMSAVHIGHDCRLGNHTVVSSNTILGGHCLVEDRVVFGGGAAVHHKCRIGRMAMVGGQTAVTQDILPFAMVSGRNSLHGLNRVGLRRNGFSPAEIAPLKEAYRRFCRQRQGREDVLAWMASQPANPLLAAWQAFLAQASPRGYARDAHTGPSEEE
ncbi:MAG: acyl-ACP--UDP-N-acetylglucosamine O-acyltransferase [Deltaproteobacteria bacterium]|nr:acyl-ACP--UDP-N-acetylglucosamine O-acyltransferase [Deltaproteobacteria bacterium]